MYGISSSNTDLEQYFKYNPDHYIGYSSKSEWNNDFLKNGIDFDENIYGILLF